MSHPYFFVCPSCRQEDTLDNDHCRACAVSVAVEATQIRCDGQTYSPAEYYDQFLAQLQLEQDPQERQAILNSISSENKQDYLRISRPAALRQGSHRFRFYGYHNLFSKDVEVPAKLLDGRLVLTRDRILFIAANKKFSWSAGDITSVTTNSHYLEFRVREEAFYQVDFSTESSLKYQIIVRKWLDQFYDASGLGQILEYQPRVITNAPERSSRPWQLKQPAVPERAYPLELVLMGALRVAIKTLFSLVIRIRIEGKANWHKGLRGIVIMNHQSALDPFLISAFWDRYVGYFTKSTEFRKWLNRLVLRWGLAFPTTRYQNDPHVVRIMRRMLSHGLRVGVYPEAERCWDGRLLPFKYGLVKIMMASREAIFPVIVENAYEFWPRWRRRPQRTEIKLTLCAPFCLLPDLYSVAEQKTYLESYFKEALGE